MGKCKYLTNLSQPPKSALLLHLLFSPPLQAKLMHELAGTQMDYSCCLAHYCLAYSYSWNTASSLYSFPRSPWAGGSGGTGEGFPHSQFHEEDCLTPVTGHWLQKNSIFITGPLRGLPPTKLPNIIEQKAFPFYRKESVWHLSEGLMASLTWPHILSHTRSEVIIPPGFKTGLFFERVGAEEERGEGKGINLLFILSWYWEVSANIRTMLCCCKSYNKKKRDHELCLQKLRNEDKVL